MKKFFNIIILSLLIILTITLPVIADSTEMSKLKLKVTESNESYEMFILLPKKYIMYAINHDGLDIGYDGANTLKYNVIPSITVDINKIVDDTYIDEGIEYVQIKLDNLGQDEYLFEILPEYTDMDMRFRVKSETRDNIMVIDNFKMKDNVCEIEYNYADNTVKTERKSDIKLKFNIKWWQILIVIILLIIIYYIYNRRSY